MVGASLERGVVLAKRSLDCFVVGASFGGNILAIDKHSRCLINMGIFFDQLLEQFGALCLLTVAYGFIIDTNLFAALFDIPHVLSIGVHAD